MTADEQLELWVNGTSKHRDGPNGGECCPDFSCCRPKLQAPEDVRRQFAAVHRVGNAILEHEMLLAFLKKLIAHDTNAKVVVT